MPAKNERRRPSGAKRRKPPLKAIKATSKEELQSLDEELTTVNSQLLDKVAELESANNDLSNLLSATELATVFLDTQFRIKRFTPPTARLFSLIATDSGRPLRDITLKFTDPDLFADAEQVLRTLLPAEKQIRSDNGDWWIRRILPYRTVENRIDGVVITFADITQLKEAAEKHAELERMVLDRTAQLEAANKELGRDITVRKDLEREILEIAAAEERRIGQDLHDGMGQELTGLSLMAQNLVDIRNSFPGAEIAGKIAEGLKRALKQVRSLSKGLIPVEVDAEGLMAALGDLATRINELKGITCTFECAAPVLIENNTKATHLYRIAQEAVTNSLKHSQGANIKICLEGMDQLVILKIQDDGIGIQDSLADSNGMGLKIMAYRAELLNANLTFQSVKNQGTEVTCTLSKGQ